MILIPSPPPAKSQVQNFLKNGGVGTVCAGCRFCANLSPPGHQKKSEKSEKKIDGHLVFPHSVSMQNDFANMSAENNLNDMITLSIEEINEANAWFDNINTFNPGNYDKRFTLDHANTVVYVTFINTFDGVEVDSVVYDKNAVTADDVEWIESEIEVRVPNWIAEYKEANAQA